MEDPEVHVTGHRVPGTRTGITGTRARRHVDIVLVGAIILARKILLHVLSCELFSLFFGLPKFPPLITTLLLTSFTHVLQKFYFIFSEKKYIWVNCAHDL